MAKKDIEVTRFLTIVVVFLTIFTVMSFLNTWQQNDRYMQLSGEVSSIRSELTGMAVKSGKIKIGPVPGCGSGIVEPELGEQCDGSVPAGVTCQGFGFSNGTLSCGSDCMYNTDNCYYYSCSDSDGGQNYNVYGYTSGYGPSGAYQIYDSCDIYDTLYLWERYCSGVYSQGAHNYCTYGCSGGRCLASASCGDGICNYNENCTSCITDCGICQQACNDSDGGQNFNMSGYTSGYNASGQPFYNYDVCLNSNTVNEYYCSGINSQNITGYCPTGCIYGHCNQSTCSDTDGGNNIYVRGTISGYNDYGYPYSSTDICSGADLYEYYCLGGTPRGSYNYCTNGCSNGQCNSAPANNTCTDSDGGIYPNIFGWVSGYKSGTPYNSSDTCLSNTTVIERYCSGTSPLNSTITCTNTTTRCSSGRCVV